MAQAHVEAAGKPKHTQQPVRPGRLMPPYKRLSGRLIYLGLARESAPDCLACRKASGAGVHATKNVKMNTRRVIPAQVKKVGGE